jgi:hypothetical protein
MSIFADDEREYLSSGVLLGRLATVGPDGAPHVVPTSFRYNSQHDTIDIGGHDFAKRKLTIGSEGDDPAGGLPTTLISLGGRSGRLPCPPRSPALTWPSSASTTAPATGFAVGSNTGPRQDHLV